jgi:CDP-paratose 2-epimerase
MAGAGQFGRPDQGIFAFWINAYLRNQPLKYIGFGGHGFQTRDALHPRDMVSVLLQQMRGADAAKPRVVNLSGGTASARSLAQLSEWCAARFGQREIGVDAAPRPFDLPWVVLDSRLAKETWNWEPQTPIDSILEEIAAHAEANPRWLDISAPR